MIGELEVPGLERIGAAERRRLREIPVPGLDGSYHQDLGNHPLALVLEGSVQGDEGREDFLTSVRDMFKAGEPVDFVADIVTATSIEKMIVTGLKVDESADKTDELRYAITLVQYTEPPPDPAPDDLGLDIGLEADFLNGLMEIPNLFSLPDFGDPTPPLKTALDGFKEGMKGFSGLGDVAKGLFGA